MARRAVLAFAILATVFGCSKPEPPADFTQAALRQLRSGEYDEAIKSASQAITEKPDAAAYLYRGRAYHYRNAMGDHQRAIADFGEAIRLEPKSSDAYYSRALARRDLGQNDLADADESTARDLDQVAQDTYRRLPDVMNSPEIAVPSEAAATTNKKAKGAGVASNSEAAQKRQYEELKDRFEPGFGDLRTPAKAAPGGATAKPGSYNDRYRQLLEQASREQVVPESAAPSLGGTSAAPSLSGTEVPGASLAAPGSAIPGSAANAGRSGSGGRPSTWQGPLQPPLISPFAQRPAVDPSGQMSPRANPNLQSPFQQNVPGATGFTPASPFGTQARQQATPVVRPFGGNAPNRYSNPAVRPANPRDYVP